LGKSYNSEDEGEDGGPHCYGTRIAGVKLRIARKEMGKERDGLYFAETLV
jgi:hypothetical protein